MKKLEAEKSPQIDKIIGTEEDAVVLLHPSLLHFVINLCLEFRMDFVLKSKSIIPTFMGLAMGMFTKLWNPKDAKVCMKLLVVCERIIFFCQENLEGLNKTGVL